MAKNPIVSVIVPMYKVEQYIKLCVDSILAQTFKDFEIILVDDSSPDNCFKLCKKLYGGNRKVRILRHEKNLGLGPARNTGMKNARGKYIYFVDSDDYILPHALEKLYNTAEKTQAQIVHSAAWYELNQDEVEPRKENLTPKSAAYTQEVFLPNNIVYRLEEHWRKYATWSMAWLSFCRRDFLEQNRIEFMPMYSEDEPFNITLLCLAERYYIINDAFYVYRKRSGSIIKARNLESLSKWIDAMMLGSRYIKNYLDRVPHFDGYEQWRENIMSKWFERLSKDRTTPYYENLSLTAETNAVVADTLKKFFGEGEPFVRFFFNQYHLFRRQAEILVQQRNILLQQNQQIKNLTATFISEQPAILKLMELIKSDAKKIFLLGTPQHGNLGDQAIVLGERYILQDYFPEHTVVEIQVPFGYLIGELGELLWGLGLEKYIRHKHLICMHGGGNLGNLWINEEQLRRKLIEKFPENKIIIFPQSICFTNDDTGRHELANSQKIYNSHKDLHLMTRDENSFNLAKGFFPQINNYLLPDAATALLGITDDVDIERKGVLFVLRRDKEKVRDDAKIKYLQKYLADKNIPFTVTDTVINERITEDNRERKVRDVLMKFRAAKVVITDRFHGVVFSFVTRTPVIAFKSFDTKISSGIRWFKNLPSIFYADDQDLSRMEKFIDDYYFAADKKVYDEFKAKDDIAAGKRFSSVLNKILGTNRIYTIDAYTSPRLPEQSTVTAAQEPPPQPAVPVDFFRQCLANPVFRNNMQLLMQVPIQDKDTQNILTTLNLVDDKYFYELRDAQPPWKPKILDVETGIDELLASGKSLARLGDGECKLMMGRGIPFQQADAVLAKKLLQILSDEETNCLVGIPKGYWYLNQTRGEKMTQVSKHFHTFIVPPIRKFFEEHCNKEKKYIGSGLVVYMSTRSFEFCASRFNKLKTLFSGRKVLIVAGETVFQNITHDFFDNVAQKEILLAPRINAWSHFDELMTKILSYPKDFVVALILGPTATVLAYELSKLGRVAYDIGHVQKDYDAFMKKADRSSAAVGKFYAPD